MKRAASDEYTFHLSQTQTAKREHVLPTKLMALNKGLLNAWLDLFSFVSVRTFIALIIIETLCNLFKISSAF